MASKDLTLNLKVETGKASVDIKNIATDLKKLEKTSLSKETATASKNMKKLKRAAAKSAEEYRKLVDLSKADYERLQKRVKLEKQRAAVINRAHGEALRIDRQRAAAIDKVNKSSKKQIGITERIKKKLFDLRSYWLAISAAIAVAAVTVVKFFKISFMSVEKFRLSVASMASSITTFSDLSGGNIDKIYANASKYAEKLALKMEVINARTIATGEQLRAMNETFIQQGVLLDVNNREQEDAFVAIANAISLITQGQNQEIQMRQEIRGLLSGDIRATNLLARMINAKLGGALKENIALWKQQGTLIENLGSHLEGFKAGSADLASTWAALSTTFETIANRYLRGLFKPIYKDIIDMSLTFSRSLLNQKDATKDVTTESNLLYKTWYSLSTTVKITLHTIKSMKGPITAMLALLSHSVEMVMVTLIGIEVLTNKLNKHQRMMESTNKGLIEGAKSLWKKIFSSPEEAAKALEKSKKAFKEAGILAGNKFSDSFFDEWKVKYHEMMGTLMPLKKEEEIEKPVLISSKTEEQIKEEEKRLNKIKQVAEAEKRAHDKVIEYISSERENKTRAIMEEVTLMANATRTQEELNKVREVGQTKLDLLETGAAERRAANNEKLLQYISTEEENTLRAIYATHDALLLKAKTQTEIEAIMRRTSLLISEVYGKETAAIEEWVGKAQASIDSLKEVSLSAAESFSSGMANAFFEFTEGTKSAGEAFEDFARSFIGQVGRMITQMLILKAIQGIAGAFSGGGGITSPGQVSGNAMLLSAKGNVFNQGQKMMEYAKGGIVNSPTIFPMAKGAGLMGEAGPEAIMPLKRTSGGKLGVESNGGSEPTTVNVTYNINAVDAASFAELTRRNPEAIAGPLINEIQSGNQGLRQAINIA